MVKGLFFPIQTPLRRAAAVHRSAYKFSFLITILFSQWLCATPAEVILIRHGEKPADKCDNELSTQGQERAQALVHYFQTNPELIRFGTPVAIFASNPKHTYNSMRAIQTVTPLSEAIHIPVQHPFTHHQFGELAKMILSTPEYDGKTVLVCWEHKMISDIAAALGVKPQPDDWDKSIFDRTWVIDFDKTGKVASFRNLPQGLLPSDSH